MMDAALTAADIDGLFSASDALAAQYRLRSALSDPSVSADVREQVATKLFSGRIPAAAVAIVASAAGAAKGSKQLEASVERAAVRASLQASGQIDEVQDEVFRFARTVQADSELQATLTDPLIETPARQQLVAKLLDGKANPATIKLAQRAVQGRGRTLVKTLDGYVEIAAQINRHQVARVTVAQPLSPEQLSQLRENLIRIYGSGVDVQVDINPEVLGGVRIEIGDELIDGTIKNRLNQARRLIG